MTSPAKYPTAAELRATVDAAKVKAMDKFAADWGTRDVGVVANALRNTIEGTTSPADWAAKARASL